MSRHLALAPHSHPQAAGDGAASGLEILYFDPSISYLAPLKDPTAKEKLQAYKGPEEVVQPGLTVCALPPVLPFFNKYRFINRSTSAAWPVLSAKR